ncbi:MAG: Gfo/Idh/MocA family protein [Nitrospirales bacterium]|nr:Gfo/Idh/MocA family oxidoreductase [Nitrospirales bacterium]
MNTTSVGLIGVGRHGSRYLSHLLTEETGGSLLAVSRRNADKGQRITEQHHLRFYQNWNDLLGDPFIQAVVVATPPILNLPIALEAIQAGKAVLLEKPLALNTLQAGQIVKLSRQAKVPVMTAHTLRYESTIQKLKEVGPSLGKWKRLSCTMKFDTHTIQSGNREGWGHYGVLMEIGIHLLDLIRFLTEEEILAVSIEMEREGFKNPETRVWGSLTTKNGVICTVDISGVSQGRTTRAEIIGSNGRAQADWANHHVTYTDKLKRTTDYPCPKTPTLVPLLKDFFRCIQTATPMTITGEDGLQAVRIAEACYQSAQSGHPVTLPSLID